MKDGEERHRTEIFDYLDKEFQFSEEEKAQKLTSGGRKLENRMVWALSALKNADLLENTAWVTTNYQERARSVKGKTKHH